MTKNVNATEGTYRAEWTMPNGSRTSGTFVTAGEAEVRATIAIAGGRDITVTEVR